MLLILMSTVAAMRLAQALSSSCHASTPPVEAQGHGYVLGLQNEIRECGFGVAAQLAEVGS